MLSSWLRRFWPLFFLVAALVAAVAAEWPASQPHRETNTAQSQNGQPGDTKNNDRSIFVKIATFADAHHDSIEAVAAGVSAIFAVILTISTIGLWVVTGSAAKATRTAAIATQDSVKLAERSLTELEGPFLYPTIEYDDIMHQFQTYDIYASNVHPPVRPNIKFNFRNYGRTPALPQSISAVFFFGQPDDTHNDNQAGFVPELLIPPGQSLSEFFTREMIQAVDRDAWLNIMKGGGLRIYLRGSIIFFDIFGNQYEQTFCLTWGPVTDKFMAWGPTRNQRRRVIHA